MAMDEKMVGHISYLARIKMGADELNYMAKDLSSIMEMVGELNEVDTGGVPMFTTPVTYPSHLRADMVDDGGIREKLMENAKENMNGFYTVPKVVE